jgi:putative YphP/YqiW family bacilliredoxin
MYNINMPMAPLYDPNAVQPMRDELTFVGFEELTTPEQVDQVMAESKDKTVLIMVNSVCGCAAGSARPGVTESLQHSVIPDKIVTVFAGQDRAATDKARSYMVGVQPSSPSIALFKNGELVAMVERRHIEGNHPKAIAGVLTGLFDKFCEKTGPSIPAERYAELVHAKACGSKIPKYSN